jgi:hypothetical protein
VSHSQVHADVREYYPLFLPEIIGRTARWLRMCPQLGTLTTAVYWLLAAGCWLLRTFLPLINPMTRKDTAQASTKYICTTSASLERFKDLDFSAVPEGGLCVSVCTRMYVCVCVCVSKYRFTCVLCVCVCEYLCACVILLIVMVA